MPETNKKESGSKANLNRAKWVSLHARLLLLALLLQSASCEKEKEQKASTTSRVESKQPSAKQGRTQDPKASATQAVLGQQKFPTAAAALAKILTLDPRIIGFGEVHQRTGSAKVQPALARFTAELLPQLAPQTADLIAETWVTEGNCGEKEKLVVKQVEKTTERPTTTEADVLTLLRRAKEAGVRPHILTVGCAEYQSLLADKEVDYEKLLALVTDHLQHKIEAVHQARAVQGETAADQKARAAPGKKEVDQKERTAQGKTKEIGKARATRSLPESASPRAPSRQLLVVYGGALHNDLFPPQGLERYTYALRLKPALQKDYVEVDLYVPEFIENDESLKKEAWYPLARQATERQVVLITRSERSYILVLRRGRQANADKDTQ